MNKTFTFQGGSITIKVDILQSLPPKAVQYTPVFFDNLRTLKGAEVSFFQDGKEITFWKDYYHYIKIVQQNNTTITSSGSISFDTAPQHQGTVILQFQNEEELKTFITSAQGEQEGKDIGAKPSIDSWASFTTTKEIHDWWKQHNPNRSMFDESNTQENVCYGLIESICSPEGYGYNKHTPPSYYDGITWDRDLPNLVETTEYSGKWNDDNTFSISSINSKMNHLHQPYLLNSQSGNIIRRWYNKPPKKYTKEEIVTYILTYHNENTGVNDYYIIQGDIQKESFDATYNEKISQKHFEAITEGSTVEDVNVPAVYRYEFDNIDIGKSDNRLSYAVFETLTWENDVTAYRDKTEDLWSKRPKHWNANLQNLEFGNNLFSNTVGLESFEGNLGKLKNGAGMFFNCQNLGSFKESLCSLICGQGMFHKCSGITEINTNLNNLALAKNMFARCENLSTFQVSNNTLPRLTECLGMFSYCRSLKEWNTEIPYIENASNMFGNCSSLQSVSADFSSVNVSNGMFQNCSSLLEITNDYPNSINIDQMFKGCTSLVKAVTNFNSATQESWGGVKEVFKDCHSLKTVDAAIPKLKSAYTANIFAGCTSLTSYKGYTPVLINGRDMFNGCPLAVWETDDGKTDSLGSLTNGYEMFLGCALNADSIENIKNNIKDVNEINKTSEQKVDGDVYTTIHLGIETIPNSDSFKRIISDLHAIRDKGWTVIATLLCEFWDKCATVNAICDKSTAIFEKELVAVKLSSLEDGSNMFASAPSPLFQNEILKDFYAYLPKLERAENMFYGCTELKYFCAEGENSLKYAFGMFSGCTKLKEFYGDLSNLEDGEDMFYDCRLNLKSLQRIASSIKPHESGTHTITLGIGSTAQAVETALNTIRNKGWNVIAKYQQ